MKLIKNMLKLVKYLIFNKIKYLLEILDFIKFIIK